ncbi:MAG: transporter ATP-binding protein [Proteobacteria bacterium]|nr:transporter ATP-binding protein [Pseudomonadota bacterium]
MKSAIHLENLGKTYLAGFLKKRRITALHDLSLEVKQGEVVGFIGPNGAGKSTTIKLIMGLLRPSTGRAELFGVPVEQPAARKGVAYVPESPLLYDTLTPLETLKMGCQMHGVATSDLDAHCKQWLERFGIAHVANKLVRSFSKGMIQRTALAHALAIQPRLLILDEPLSGLDPIGRKDVVDILMDYRKGGGTLFFSSHVLHDVERLADRFGLIHKGVLRTVQSPHELLGREQQFSVRTVGSTAVDGMREDVSGCWFAEVPQNGLWPLLQRLQAAGHQILEVKPALTLERVFLEYVQGEAVTDKAQD